MLHDAADAGEPYDVAIVDFHMPGMSGLELCQCVQAAPRLRGTRLLMLTSAIPGIDLTKAAGIAAHLTKPVRQARLREAIAGALATPPVPVAEPTHVYEPVARPVVLVAEDHPVNQLVIRKLLEQEGLEVDVADDGEQALARVAAREYAAVFMDCQMPVLDGYAATAALRDTDRGEGLPIIALTAHAMTGDRERCLAAGMDDYLAKPISPAELARVLTQWRLKRSE
jgi:two-component system, sensor histidine kinase and response regulator